MNYSFMTFSCPQLSLKELLETAKRYGYDGIEPRIFCQHNHGIEVKIPPVRRAEIKKQADESDIALSCIATSCVYANPETARQNVADTLQCIDLAADVGAPVIRVFGGTMGKGLSRADAVNLVAESLHALAEHARERNITVCMETHDDWCDPKNVAAVMRQVNHPAIAVNWDIMHPVRMKLATMEKAFEILKPWIRHLHVHDGNTLAGKLTLMPIGQGIIDHKLAIEHLLSVNYSGFLSGEWIDWSDAYDVHLPRELAAMKRFEKEVKCHPKRLPEATRLVSAREAKACPALARDLRRGADPQRDSLAELGQASLRPEVKRPRLRRRLRRGESACFRATFGMTIHRKEQHNENKNSHIGIRKKWQYASCRSH